MLKKKRLRAGIKINKICETLGVSRSTYYLIELGKRELSNSEKEKLDNLLS